MRFAILGVVDEVSVAIEPLFGLPSWQITNFHGSMLMVEFGTPSVEVGEPRVQRTDLDEGPSEALQRRAGVHGDWTLTVEYCEWEIRVGEELLAHSESAEPTMRRALRVLWGQALSAVRVDSETGTSEFIFDLGAVFRTSPAPAGFYGEGPVEQWTLRRPDGRYIAVRDDGMFSTHQGDADPESYVWSRLHT